MYYIISNKSSFWHPEVHNSLKSSQFSWLAFITKYLLQTEKNNISCGNRHVLLLQL